jgi:hypothetical protein
MFAHFSALRLRSAELSDRRRTPNLPVMRVAEKLSRTLIDVG